jgi:hypothetical protein
MKRFLLTILILCLVAAPTMAEPMDEGVLVPVPEGGGLSFTEDQVTIALDEDADSGYVWTHLLGDETVLTLISDQALSSQGAGLTRAFTFAPAGDGVTEISLFYEQPVDEGDVAQMLIYTVWVEGGKVALAEYEDAGWEGEGDDDGAVLYDGDDGGVFVYVPEDLIETSRLDGVTRLENQDASIFMTIEYDPDADAGSLFEELADPDAVEEAYAEDGTMLIAAEADLEADPPRGIVVYQTCGEDGFDVIIEYTAYQAPEGGVLHVRTGYVLK